MRLLFLTAIATLLVGCTTEGESHDSLAQQASNEQSTPTLDPSPTAGIEETAPASAPSDWLGLERPELDRIPDPTTAEPSGPDRAPEADSYHPQGGTIAHPNTRSDPPDQLRPPLEVAVWVAEVLLTTTPNDSDRATVTPYLAPPLAARFAKAQPSLQPDGAKPVTQAVLVDAWVNVKSSTATVVDAVAVFERTRIDGAEVSADFELVFLDFVLHSTPSGWQVVEIVVSFG